jgi:hypothetical protein
LFVAYDELYSDMPENMRAEQALVVPSFIIDYMLNYS